MRANFGWICWAAPGATALLPGYSLYVSFCDLSVGTNLRDIQNSGVPNVKVTVGQTAAVVARASMTFGPAVTRTLSGHQYELHETGRKRRFTYKSRQ